MSRYNKPVFCRCNPRVSLLNVQPAVSSLVEKMALEGVPAEVERRNEWTGLEVSVRGSRSGSGRAEQYLVQVWQVAPEAYVFRVFRNEKQSNKWLPHWLWQVPATGQPPQGGIVVALGLAMSLEGAEATARSFIRVRCKMEKMQK